LTDDAVAASLRQVVRGIVGGYVAFLAIVLIFHVWVADDPAAFVSAAGGGAFLWGVVMVVVDPAPTLSAEVRIDGRARRLWLRSRSLSGAARWSGCD
jgi:hypothetical protein